ncbi:MAG TPA: agmatine deiminase family protein [Ignavibacteriaceae bacterium]|jgi:agmatine deiminase|nr:agmatine deiminase family protein [Ignavibacteriaceae bacterium]HQI40995.1 agmatine deiminase family protein [Ignavibacteriaceae bacterium]
MEKKYRLPAEWEYHESTWIGWPANKQDWPGKFQPIPWVYGEIVRYISREEKVRIIVQSKEHQKKAEAVLKAVGVDFSNIDFFKLATNRNWLRDAGPQFVKNKKNETVLIKFDFNAWAKYNNYRLDEKIPNMISNKLNLKLIEAEHKSRKVILEGGSIDYNGFGTLITTEECLMDPKIQVRNPGFIKKDYEKVFEKYLGITNVIWLNKGIAGDDTHGHVDDITRFVNKNTVVTVVETHPNDPNYIPLMENIEILESAKLEDSSGLEIVELPMPSPVFFKGERLPASYANFYISNYAVLVPTFNDPNDKNALGILSELFTDRPVIGIHAVDLVWGLGTLHCLTHEQIF